MRNRTEQVTNKMDDSGSEEDFVDSGSEYEPDEEAPAKPSKKAPAKKAAAKRKVTPTKAKKPAKKSKKQESDDEFDSEFEEDEGGEDEEYLDEENLNETATSSTATNGVGSTRGGGGNKTVMSGKHFPDKAGIFCLYAYKGDLKNGMASNKNLCLWRRDGASLLQKYIRDKDSDDGKTIVFNSSMVYSCWEERRKDEYLELKVVCCGTSKDSRVQVCDLNDVEATIVKDNYAGLTLDPYVSYADKEGGKEGSSSNNGANSSQNTTQEFDDENEDGEEDGEYDD